MGHAGVRHADRGVAPFVAPLPEGDAGGRHGDPLSSSSGREARLRFARARPCAAAAIWEAGADAVYLFNYFQDDWRPETYRKLLLTLGSPEKVAQAPRWNAVTYRDIVGPGEEYRPPLPAEGRSSASIWPVSPAPGRDWAVRVVLGLENAAEPPAIRVNGEEGVLEKAEAHEAVYSVPRVAFAGRARAEIGVHGRTAGAW